MSQPDPPAPGWRGWLIAVLLAGCYAVAYLDRQVISLLIKPIKASLSLSDTRFGLLQGISFSLFYVGATYPLAWLADRTRRSRVMSASVAAWSVMTMSCGLAGSFGFKSEHEALSRQIGNDRFVPTLQEKALSSTLVIDGFSCQTQAGHLGAPQGVSIPELLATLLSPGLPVGPGGERRVDS